MIEDAQKGRKKGDMMQFEYAGMKYELDLGAVTASVCVNDCTEGDVVISADVECDGIVYPVVAIGEYAFSECSGVASVSIPNSVASIGDYAFSRCSGLTEVVIPGSVTSIGDCAFDEGVSIVRGE